MISRTSRSPCDVVFLQSARRYAASPSSSNAKPDRFIDSFSSGMDGVSSASDSDHAFQHPAVDVGHETEAKRGRQKRVRAEHSILRRQPQQHLVVRDDARFDVHQRLVEQLESIRLERGAQTVHRHDVLRDLLALLAGRAVDLDSITAVRFRRSARDVALRNDLVRARSVAVDQRDADAALQMKDLLALDVLQAAHQLEHFGRGHARFVARHVAHEHGELVAAEPSDEILRTYGVAQLLSGQLEQVVAGRVAARVVDVLELVEVDEEQRAARAGVGAASQLALRARRRTDGGSRGP